MADLKCQACARGDHGDCSAVVYVRLVGQENAPMKRLPCQCPGTYITGVRVKAGDLYLSTTGKVRERTKAFTKRVTTCGLALAQTGQTEPAAPKREPAPKQASTRKALEAFLKGR